MTRREIWDTVNRAAASVYDAREARAVTAFVCEGRLGLRFTDVIVEPDAPCPLREELAPLMAEIRDRRPAQYIAGYAFFRDMKFIVREGVLIPRPETEEMVGLIEAEHRGEKGLRVLDIGTGSGCIAVSLALALPESRVTGIDISDSALATASENARRLGAEVRFERHDILSESVPEGTYDLVVSNPPYVTRSEQAQMLPNVLRHEPHRALFVPDDDPLLFYRAIAEKGRTMIARGGELWFEINERFGPQTVRLLEDEGYADIRLREDMFGKPRTICARWK